MSYYCSSRTRKQAKNDLMIIVSLCAIAIVALFIIITIAKSAHFGQRVLSTSERRRADQASDYAYTDLKEYFAQKIEDKTGRKPEKMALWVGSPMVGYYVVSVYYRYNRVWYCYRIEKGHEWMTPEVEDWASDMIHY